MTTARDVLGENSKADGDVMCLTDICRVSLNCPGSLARMKIPIRGKDCKVRARGSPVRCNGKGQNIPTASAAEAAFLPLAVLPANLSTSSVSTSTRSLR
ncbi:MAG: hypothetical protein BJ554DRAFT_7670 [Olpidium bornovanus]|uniref:Uncharacterized protein n=1 Tax=Olpidium bornovanus TaxID=278681 RepID=A0A8H8DJ75_9FUNG|nr:MAG: hypothetical protein BJ554DRAFT_7670 [Olpidium bornovanus]